MTQPRLHIEAAIALLGSQAKLAAAMGCSQQQISYLLGCRRVTAEMAIAIDAATNGKVSKHDLRADLFGAAVPATSWVPEPTTTPAGRPADESASAAPDENSQSKDAA